MSQDIHNRISVEYDESEFREDELSAREWFVVGLSVCLSAAISIFTLTALVQWIV